MPLPGQLSNGRGGYLPIGRNRKGKNYDASIYAEHEVLEMGDRLTSSRDPRKPLQDDPESRPQTFVSRASARRTPNVLNRLVTKIMTHWRQQNVRFDVWKRESGFSGWRMGVFLGCCTAAFVLCANVTILLGGLLTDKGYQDGFATLMKGSGTRVSALSTLCHIVINVLSTLFLSASNYTMQVLSSPSRKNIDDAHQQGEWLDIGILSVRNIKAISNKRKVLWWIVGLSSVPLHLFYNSGFVAIVTFYDYRAEFVEYQSPRFQTLNSTHNLANITIPSWLDAYRARYPSTYGNTYIIIDRIKYDFEIQDYQDHLREKHFSNLTLPHVEPTYYERRGTGINDDGWLSDLTGFNLEASSLHARHAFSERPSNDAKLQISLHFMLVVIICNIVKLIVMLLTLLDRNNDYMVTIGDAIGSFLKAPDKTTSQLCTVSREGMLWMTGNYKRMAEHDYRVAKYNAQASGIWQTPKRRYISSISATRRLFGTLFLLGAVLGGIMALILTKGSPFSSAWGTGSTTAFSLAKNSWDTAGTLLNAWMANLPQLLVSLSYLVLNGLVTCMALAHEWNQFASSRKSLRVIKPEGKQRSTYFLQLPYRWSTPLAAISCLVHWLTSQTFFLIRLTAMNSDGQLLEEESLSACGVSKLSAFVLVVMLGALVIVVTVISVFHFKARIPFAASCSFVISAACHPPPNQVNPHLNEVQWGVVDDYQVVEGEEHYSFSADAVTEPRVGFKYA